MRDAREWMVKQFAQGNRVAERMARRQGTVDYSVMGSVDDPKPGAVQAVVQTKPKLKMKTVKAKMPESIHYPRPDDKPKRTKRRHVDSVSAQRKRKADAENLKLATPKVFWHILSPKTWTAEIGEVKLTAHESDGVWQMEARSGWKGKLIGSTSAFSTLTDCKQYAELLYHGLNGQTELF